MEMETISELMKTQDNRGTDQPMFIVQEKERIYGLSYHYSSDYVWADSDDNDIADTAEAKRLDGLEITDDVPPNWSKVYYEDRWQFVTMCFTEQGCKDYLSANGHNHGETRIYGWHTHRNAEMQAVRNHLISIST